MIATASAQASRANQAQTRWYDAYQQAVRAVERRDWSTAEKFLLQAKTSGPRPGRRVLAYGDTYMTFLPDYYLGVVYLNTNRNAQAEAAFQAVREQKVIGPKDPEYVAFERQGREATFNRAFGEAQQLAVAGNFSTATTRLAEARATNVDDAKVNMLSKEIAARQQVVAAAPPPTPAPMQNPVQTAPPEPVGAGTSPPVASNPPLTTPTFTTPRSTQTKLGPSNSTVANMGVIAPKALPSPARSTALRDGALAFFSGDYGSAIPLLQDAVRQPDAAPRAQVLLACAKVGLVLTGGGDVAMLRQTHSDFQSAGLQQYLTSADRRFISPKILQQLERR